jgi:hypothetical protein
MAFLALNIEKQQETGVMKVKTMKNDQKRCFTCFYTFLFIS